MIGGTQTLLTLDAHGDLLRGLQVVETAAGVTSTLMGEKMEGAYNARVPVHPINELIGSGW